MLNRSDITVLVVDDSWLARRSLRTVLTDAGFNVVGEASSGDEGVALARQLHPTVVTMDLFMPGMNGLEAIEEIMATDPTRILVVTAATELAGRDTTFESLSRGALDLLPKPTAWPATDEERVHIVREVERLAEVPVVLHPRAAQSRRERARRVRPHPAAPLLVAVGGSTGAPGVLKTILGQLPPTFPVPIVVVQHLAQAFAEGFVEWLDEVSPMRICEARSGTIAKPGVVYVVVRPPHIVVTADGRLCASDEPPRGAHHPAVDVLFESVATSFEGRGAGVLLTGMGRDGAAGLERIGSAGGLTIVQDQESCAVFGMPAAAIELGRVDEILPPAGIASCLIQAVSKGGAP